MQPANHMKPSEDELITHIKDSLSVYEEAYVPGSWEKFNDKKESKKGIIFWLGPLGGIAAAVLVGIAVFLFVDKDTEQQKPLDAIVKNKVKAAPENPGTGIREHAGASLNNGQQPIVIGEDETPLSVNQNVKAVTTVASVEPTIEPAQDHAETQVAVNTTSSNNSVVAVKTDEMTAQAVQPEKKVTEPVRKQSIEDFLNKESKANLASNSAVKASVNQEDKWDVGVMVAPSFGNAKKLNMGYGLSMGYALSNKVSISSGISYNEMTASKSITGDGSVMNAPGPADAIAQGSKSLQSIDQRVTGIDIPLELKYNLSKNFYANVGVSAFAIINEQRSNNYLEQRVVERNSLDAPAGGSNAFMVSEKVTETAPEADLKQGRYIGFYNFSLGFKQKITKANTVSIEPFMKVPMKDVTKDNLRLIGTGLKLKFDF